MLSFSDYIQVPGLLLEKIAGELDIPDSLYEDAVIKYEDIGEWLSENHSELKKYLPEIYPQGSFRLGTVVRPISEKEEYLDHAINSWAFIQKYIIDHKKGEWFLLSSPL